MLNCDDFAYLWIGIAGTLAIVLLPILLSKFVMKFRDGFKDKNEKLMREGFYYLLSSCIAVFIILTGIILSSLKFSEINFAKLSKDKGLNHKALALS